MTIDKELRLVDEKCLGVVSREVVKKAKQA